MHFQCWSFYCRSLKYGHVPRTRYHLVSCGQLSVFTSGITQCIFRRYLSVSFRHTYYGRILSSKGVISRPTKRFLPNSPFWLGYYLLKIPKSGIQLPNAGDDNQKCRILTFLFNSIDWLWVTQYNIYSSTLLYINVLIYTMLRGCATSFGVWVTFRDRKVTQR